MSENDLQVLQAVRTNGPITRGRLMTVVKLPRTTIYDALVRLQLLGLVTPFLEDRQRRGRSRTFWEYTGPGRTPILIVYDRARGVIV